MERRKATMERGVKIAIMFCIFAVIAGCSSIPIIIYSIYSRSQHHHITAARDILYDVDINNCPQKVYILIAISMYIGTYSNLLLSNSV